MLKNSIWVVLLLASACVASDSRETHTETQAFAPNGSLRIHLNVGDLRIVPGDPGRLQLRYTVRCRQESWLKDAEVKFEVHGSSAEIGLDSHHNNCNIDAEIEAPPATNLNAAVNVGDLEIRRISGEKDLGVKVGDIRVDLERDADYGMISADTGVGDVNAPGFGESKGFLGKSLKYQGSGPYRLRAHVSVGDINLRR